MKRMNRPRLPGSTARTRRLVALAVLAIAASVVVISSVGAKDTGGYQVRGQWVDAGGITKGADVRIAGANVGTIKQIFVSKNNQAALVLNITDPAFQMFYTDAHCRVRLQSLIGEKFIDCDPGTPGKPQLPADPTDPTRRLLLASHTGSPVDSDQLLDTMREPQRERFRVIINELGITLTGRGQDLQDILNRFDPTFKQVDALLKILAKENKQLEVLAVDGDRSLQSLAANRKHITSFFHNADIASRATNEKRAELAQTLARLPAFLDQLEPTAKVLKRFAIESAPVASATRAAGNDISTFTVGTNAFVQAANPALTKFGASSDVLRAQLPKLIPLSNKLRTISDNRGSVLNLKKLLKSFEDQNGYKNLAALAIGLAGSANGVNSFGHFLRSVTVLNGACLPPYAQQYSRDCSADFATSHAPDNSPPAATKGNSKSSAAATSSASTGVSSSDAAGLDYLLGGDK
jgi:phospholipid/cholesterol/gamma-HCH transport system substrate-binding protein